MNADGPGGSAVQWPELQLDPDPDGPGPGHHVRRDARHQHGPRRDADAGGLHRLRPEPLPRPRTCSGRSRRRSWRSGLVGYLMEVCLIRFLYGRPLDTLLATWGVGLVLQKVMSLALGQEAKLLSPPGFLSGSWEVGGLTFGVYRVFVVGRHGAVPGRRSTCVFFKTTFGLKVRAVTQNRPMASALGISTRRVDALTFALGTRPGGRGRLHHGAHVLDQGGHGHQLRRRRLHGGDPRRRRADWPAPSSAGRSSAPATAWSPRCSTTSRSPAWWCCCWSSSSSSSARRVCSRPGSVFMTDPPSLRRGPLTMRPPRVLRFRRTIILARC